MKKTLLMIFAFLVIGSTASAASPNIYKIHKVFQGTWIMTNVSRDGGKTVEDGNGVVVGTVYAAKIVLPNGADIPIAQIITQETATDIETFIRFDSGILWEINHKKKYGGGVARIRVFQNEAQAKVSQEQLRMIVEIH